MRVLAIKYFFVNKLNKEKKIRNPICGTICCSLLTRAKRVTPLLFFFFFLPLAYFALCNSISNHCYARLYVRTWSHTYAYTHIDFYTQASMRIHAVQTEFACDSKTTATERECGFYCLLLSFFFFCLFLSFFFFYKSCWCSVRVSVMGKEHASFLSSRAPAYTVIGELTDKRGVLIFFFFFFLLLVCPLSLKGGKRKAKNGVLVIQLKR